MRDRDDDNRLLVDPIDQAIRESRNKTAADSGCDFQRRAGKLERSSQRPVEFIKELLTEPVHLSLVPRDGIVKLLLSQR